MSGSQDRRSVGRWIAPCEGGWISVMPALSGDQGSNVSVAGDLIELAVLCESGEQLVTSSTDR